MPGLTLDEGMRIAERIASGESKIWRKEDIEKLAADLGIHKEVTDADVSAIKNAANRLFACAHV